jgi:hypothetical protein
LSISNPFLILLSLSSDTLRTGGVLYGFQILQRFIVGRCFLIAAVGDYYRVFAFLLQPGVRTAVSETIQNQ